MDNFGKRLALQRKKIGLTQQGLADVLIVSNKTVSKWESGLGFPSFEFLPQICEALNCSADYLILGEHSFEHYKRIKDGILVCIGTDENGKEYFEDILRFPHLLAIGETGSGKSCLFHSFIMDILKNYTPEKVKLGLIDCKIVEFHEYSNIPYLLCPIVNTKEQAAELLENLIEEKERRFDLFRAAGIKSIFEYNKINKEKLPFNIIIIDELAEIICDEKVKWLLIDLIKTARAAGIHILMATQRLRGDTLPYELKQYILTRVCFKVDVRQQSEDYFDFAGGEKLKGFGEMLFYKTNNDELLKLQGKFYTLNEIQKILIEKGYKIPKPIEFDEEIIELAKSLLIKEEFED